MGTKKNYLEIEHQNRGQNLVGKKHMKIVLLWAGLLINVTKGIFLHGNSVSASKKSVLGGLILHGIWVQNFSTVKLCTLDGAQDHKDYNAPDALIFD